MSKLLDWKSVILPKKAVVPSLGGGHELEFKVVVTIQNTCVLIERKTLEYHQPEYMKLHLKAVMPDGKILHFATILHAAESNGRLALLPVS